MVDFHSHFLPGIDDGADSVECSLEMLADFKSQGVNTVIATSHYYDWQGNITEFLTRREHSYNKLQQALQRESMECPDIVLAAEVALTPDIPKMDDLKKLCIGDSNAIMIELPYSGYYEWIPYALFEISSKYGLAPVLAHFERFCTDKKKFEQYKSLLELDVKVQVNTDSILDRRSYKIVKKLVKMGAVHVIGSDAHSMRTRKSNFYEGAKRIEKKFGKDYLLELNNNAKKIINLT